MGEKLAPRAAHYRPAQRERRCGACVSFRPAPGGGGCDRVEGPVAPAMCCDLWRPLKHGGETGDPPPGAPRRMPSDE